MLVQKNHTAIVVAWEPPSKPRGKILDYTIRITPPGEPGDKKAPASDINVTFTNMEAGNYVYIHSEKEVKRSVATHVVLCGFN